MELQKRFPRFGALLDVLFESYLDPILQTPVSTLEKLELARRERDSLLREWFKDRILYGAVYQSLEGRLNDPINGFQLDLSYPYFIKSLWQDVEAICQAQDVDKILDNHYQTILQETQRHFDTREWAELPWMVRLSQETIAENSKQICLFAEQLYQGLKAVMDQFTQLEHDRAVRSKESEHLKQLEHEYLISVTRNLQLKADCLYFESLLHLHRPEALEWMQEQESRMSTLWDQYTQELAEIDAQLKVYGALGPDFALLAEEYQGTMSEIEAINEEIKRLE